MLSVSVENNKENECRTISEERNKVLESKILKFRLVTFETTVEGNVPSVNTSRKVRGGSSIMKSYKTDHMYDKTFRIEG